MMSIDIAVNGQQIAYITVEKGQPRTTMMEHDFTVSLFNREHPAKAKAVKVTHNDDFESDLTLLRKVFTKLEESSNR